MIMKVLINDINDDNDMIMIMIMIILVINNWW